MKSVSHCSHCWYFRFTHKSIDDLFSLQFDSSSGAIFFQSKISLVHLQRFSLDSLENSAGREDFGLHLSDDSLALDGNLSVPDPLDVREVAILMDLQQIVVM